MTDFKPKLIEKALPLATINAEAAREKSIRHGHPSTLHLWWARRPLATARAVIWASLVDDPSCDDSLTEEEQNAERQRLFKILEELVKWENSNNPDVLAKARAEIDRCFPDGPPPILDPFAGGGSIPLEAQRLGLKALSGDLNPVAVLIQKAMIEIPPRFADQPPVHPDLQDELKTWERAQGLAADVEAYGRWMRDEAERRIGHLYPDVTDADGNKRTPIAWIWARTVESPDPSWNGHVPLVASWTLSNRTGKPKVWIEPIVNRETQSITYRVRHGGEPSVRRTCSRGKGVCVATGAAIPGDYIKEQGQLGRMRQSLMAVVAEGSRVKVYCEASEGQAARADCETPSDLPEGQMSDHPQYMGTPRYGIDEWTKLFTPRQLTALTTFSDLLQDVHAQVCADVKRGGGLARKGQRLRDGGTGAESYADAIVTYLAFVIDKCADYWSSICSWSNTRETIRSTFGRQAIPMVWDYCEANPFSASTGSWTAMLDWVQRAVAKFPGGLPGHCVQRDAHTRVSESKGACISTDPPYYDAVPYSDISDFFYVWLRRNLRTTWPDECATVLTPKLDEMVADNRRFGSREGARAHFESGMRRFMGEIVDCQTEDVPATVYYAYKATEQSDEGTTSTGWDTFLQAVIDAGLQVTATWPMRTELSNRLRANRSNALASSIVLACRPLDADVSRASRGDFIAALRAELPDAVSVLQSGNIAPVDLAQSTIGPGIKVFSRYSKVVGADGTSMRVSDALALINDALGEILDGEEADIDADTRFAITWFAEHGYNPGPAGDADQLARAKNTSVDGIQEAGIGEAHAGEFRLFERSELDEDWDPATDSRPTVWEATQHLLVRLRSSEREAGELLRSLGAAADEARQLAYVLYQKASDNGWAEEANAYNGLINAWPILQSMPGTGEMQGAFQSETDEE